MILTWKKREEEGCTADMETCTPSHSHFSSPVGIWNSAENIEQSVSVKCTPGLYHRNTVFTQVNLRTMLNIKTQMKHCENGILQQMTVACFDTVGLWKDWSSAHVCHPFETSQVLETNQSAVIPFSRSSSVTRTRYVGSG